jgi:hypothetical protein
VVVLKHHHSKVKVIIPLPVLVGRHLSEFTPTDNKAQQKP